MLTSDIILDVCKQLKKRNEKITNRNIAKEIGRTNTYISERTMKLVKEGKLIITKKRTRVKKGRGFSEREFDLP